MSDGDSSNLQGKGVLISFVELDENTIGVRENRVKESVDK